MKGTGPQSVACFNRRFNSSYQQVHEDYKESGIKFVQFSGIKHNVYPNPHEYNMLPGGKSFLQIVMYGRHKDLRPWNGERDGWYEDGCFNEVDAATGQPTFTWCTSDHFPINATFVLPDVPANRGDPAGVEGKGTWFSLWDFVHLNAVDKMDGNYIVSGRHLDSLLYIAGNDNQQGVKPGTVLWALGGRYNNFTMEGDFMFCRQHHVRFVNRTSTSITLTVFNNGNCHNSTLHPLPHNQVSRCLLITLDNTTMTAKVEQEYIDPVKRVSHAAGSCQVRDNGNVFVGYGREVQYCEFSANATLLYHAEWPDLHSMNYRSIRSEWVGRPDYPPKLLAYKYSCKHESPLVVYVSWNGATEVKSYRFSASISGRGPWMTLAKSPRTGFETRVELSSGFSSFGARLVGFPHFMRVEALDGQGYVLGESSGRTYVPITEKSKDCDADGCEKFFDYQTDNCSGLCDRAVLPSLAALILFVTVYELGQYWMSIWLNGMTRVARTSRPRMTRKKSKPDYEQGLLRGF